MRLLITLWYWLVPRFPCANRERDLRYVLWKLYQLIKVNANSPDMDEAKIVTSLAQDFAKIIAFMEHGITNKPPMRPCFSYCNGVYHYVSNSLHPEMILTHPNWIIPEISKSPAYIRFSLNDSVGHKLRFTVGFLNSSFEVNCEYIRRNNSTKYYDDVACVYGDSYWHGLKFEDQESFDSNRGRSMSSSTLEAYADLKDWINTQLEQYDPATYNEAITSQQRMEMAAIRGTNMYNRDVVLPNLERRRHSSALK